MVLLVGLRAISKVGPQDLTRLWARCRGIRELEPLGEDGGALLGREIVLLLLGPFLFF